MQFRVCVFFLKLYKHEHKLIQTYNDVLFPYYSSVLLWRLSLNLIHLHICLQLSTMLIVLFTPFSYIDRPVWSGTHLKCVEHIARMIFIVSLVNGIILSSSTTNINSMNYVCMFVWVRYMFAIKILEQLTSCSRNVWKLPDSFSSRTIHHRNGIELHAFCSTRWRIVIAIL